MSSLKVCLFLFVWVKSDEAISNNNICIFFFFFFFWCICIDEYEVAIFLRESRTSYSLLTKDKVFENDEKNKKKNVRNNDNNSDAEGILVESDSSNDEIALRDIPQQEPAPEDDGTDNNDRPRSRSRQRQPVIVADSTDEDDDNNNEDDSAYDDDDRAKRRKTSDAAGAGAGEEKKLRFHTDYESFNISGWVLCLLITRRDVKGKSRASNSIPPEGGSNRQALMEEWILTAPEGNPDEE